MPRSFEISGLSGVKEIDEIAGMEIGFVSSINFASVDLLSDLYGSFWEGLCQGCGTMRRCESEQLRSSEDIILHDSRAQSSSKKLSSLINLSRNLDVTQPSSITRERKLRGPIGVIIAKRFSADKCSICTNIVDRVIHQI